MHFVKEGQGFFIVGEEAINSYETPGSPMVANNQNHNI
jgi:hypothetical protein